MNTYRLYHTSPFREASYQVYHVSSSQEECGGGAMRQDVDGQYDMTLLHSSRRSSFDLCFDSVFKSTKTTRGKRSKKMPPTNLIKNHATARHYPSRTYTEWPAAARPGGLHGCVVPRHARTGLPPPIERSRCHPTRQASRLLGRQGKVSCSAEGSQKGRPVWQRRKETRHFQTLTRQTLFRSYYTLFSLP